MEKTRFIRFIELLETVVFLSSLVFYSFWLGEINFVYVITEIKPTWYYQTCACVMKDEQLDLVWWLYITFIV